MFGTIPDVKVNEIPTEVFNFKLPISKYEPNFPNKNKILIFFRDYGFNV